MKTRLKIQKKLSIVFLLVSFAVTSQVETREINFGAGESSATVKGNIRGEQTIDYTFTAKEGMLLEVTLKTSNLSNYFNVLPPGSNDEAIFIGSIAGNSCKEQLKHDGLYKIRVFLYRNAARRNEQANFELLVGLQEINPRDSYDAKVSGTNYHATGTVPAAVGNQQVGTESADFGVIRHSNTAAEVHVTMAGTQNTRILKFEEGEWYCLSDNCSISFERLSGAWLIRINDNEHYQIPDEVITGG